MKAIDLTGQKYGRLTVLEKAEPIRFKGSGKTKTRWLCRCDCGNIVTVTTGSLRNGTTQSCGCYALEKASINGRKRKTHGMTKTRLYDIWHGMKRRCNVETDSAYKNYGGRGITVCEEWNEFEPFMKWALANGYQDDLTIERKDVNGNYEPSNCTWATRLEQARNKRKSIRSYGLDGKEAHIRDIVDGKRIPYWVIEDRIRKGWDVEQAMRTPLKRNEDRGRWVEQIDINTGDVIEEYKSIVEASRKTGLPRQSIRYRCIHGGSELGGYMWRFKKKLQIKIKYLADIDKIVFTDKGNMIDLRCSEDIVMKKGEYKLIPLGVSMKLPEGYFAEIFPRSSTFGKYRIIMANSTGIVDNTYSGTTDMWYFPAYATEDVKIEKNTRICQFMIVKQMPSVELLSVDKLDSVDRGGFGSTGSN